MTKYPNSACETHKDVSTSEPVCIVCLAEENTSLSDALAAIQEKSAQAESAEQHPDDAAVDRFAIAMKAKLAKARAKGRGGWNDRAVCSQADLSAKLAEHVTKGDPVDVANFCMMLHQRGESISKSDD